MDNTNLNPAQYVKLELQVDDEFKILIRYDVTEQDQDIICFNDDDLAQLDPRMFSEELRNKILNMVAWDIIKRSDISVKVKEIEKRLQ